VGGAACTLPRTIDEMVGRGTVVISGRGNWSCGYVDFGWGGRGGLVCLKSSDVDSMEYRELEGREGIV